jgi:hypothetical protein
VIVKIIGPRDSRGRMKYARLLMNPERRMDDKRLVHTERWFGACCDMVEAAAMTRKRAAVLIAVLIAAALLLASPIPNFVGLILYVGIYQGLFPETISWDAKNAYQKCYGAIADPRRWPPGPYAACEAMWLCANEAVLTKAQHDGLYSQISKTPGCQEP